MKSNLIINDNQSSWIENALLISALALFPLLYLTLRGWTNTLTFVLFVIALFYFLRLPGSARGIKNISGTEWAVIMALASGQQCRLAQLISSANQLIKLNCWHEPKPC